MGTPPPSRASVAHSTATLAAQLAEAHFRDLMSAFPTGVTVVTATDTDGRPHGMTCTSVTSVSLTPPMLLVCLTPGQTLAAALATGRFAVNFLHSRGRAAAEIFSTPGVPRFDRVKWAPLGAGRPPRLVDHAFAVASCTVRNATTAGDHQVVLGDVDIVIDHQPDRPLMYGFRQFADWSFDERSGIRR
ncbi:flavin reductase family protein [Amycolatopsis samaneae]|uniref:Flavin reductase family protein n=1 Tax=Amycolatopsis samaneae TaxID=664691 RepID=A0ABW5GP62_9PSEU